MTNIHDPRNDRLYQLLPAIHRMRDAERGEPLRQMLALIAEQVNVVEDDIARLYRNWFIETADDWVVPYLGDLIGYRPVHEAGEPGDPNDAQGSARNKILTPRREVANTIRYRRRKGTLALLEELARDSAGWPARAVEFYTLLGWTQHLNHQHPGRGGTTSLRGNDALAQLDGPFDRLAHTVDIRRVNSTRTRGRHNIPSVGLYVWRLKPYSITSAPANCVEESGPQCYEFSVLGNDTQLFNAPTPEPDANHIAEEANLPAPIRRWAFDANKSNYYGGSFTISAADWPSVSAAAKVIPADKIDAADLSDWAYTPAKSDRIAVDVVRGRIVFPPGNLPKKGVRVSYTYGFSADMGGGEYERPMFQPDELKPEHIYRVGEAPCPFQTIAAALKAWADAKPESAVIEICNSGVYVEKLDISIAANTNLHIRAANGTRPVVRLIDWQTDRPDSLGITLATRSRITLDGLTITGRSVNIRGAEHDNACVDPCPSEVVIRHCTLVPGWGLDCDCNPRRPAEPSLELFDVRARVRIVHSIVGSIQINESQVRDEPIPVTIEDSIIDATGDAREAIGGPGRPVAHAVLTVRRSTVFGEVLVHAIDLAENSIFTNCVSVARRQRGCMRFCYVPKCGRTPRRFHCQPDLVKEAARDAGESDAVIAREVQRVRPLFNSVRYGRHDYAQLSDCCALEIRRGAEDESELGAFHDLFNPQREANLRARLDEYTPASMQAGILFAT